MDTNFKFLEKTDKNLFNIIIEAEKLYRDEYFEPCMAQTRRFGEAVCKKILGDSVFECDTFDNMLATLKDKAFEEQEKEFVEDLYFLKKQGNQSVHSVKVNPDGITALECLQRAFEIAINYAVYYAKGDSAILKLQFDTEMLITGKKSSKSLSDKYVDLKEKTFVKNTSKKKEKFKPQSSKTKSIKKNHSDMLFKILMSVSAVISLVIFITMLVLINF